MLKLRLWITATLAWLLLFYNIERFHEPINIASFVYVYAALIAMLTIAIRSLQRTPPGLLLAVLLTGLLALKWTRGYEILGTSLPLTITESCAIAITLFVSRAIAQSISRFEQGAADMLSLPLPDFRASQVEFYQEVRRARQFQRPLSLLAIAPHGASNSIEINRFIQEVQQKAVASYINARVRDLIDSKTKDCDIMAYSDNHFVLLLPEVSGEQAEHVGRRLQSAARESLGLDLRVGQAAFPGEEVTLSGMLERAVSTMRGETAAPKNGRSEFGRQGAVAVHDSEIPLQSELDFSDAGQTDEHCQA